MAGLLGLSDDPQTLGLLSLGLRLMSNPSRRFGAALGQSGLGALSDIQQAQAAQDERKSRALREQLVRQQIEQGSMGLEAARREAALDQLPGQFIRPPMVAGADGTDAGAGAGGGQMDAGMMDLAGLRQAYLGKGAMQRAAQVEQLIPKAAKPEFKVVGDNLVRIDPQGSVAEAYRSPEKPTKADSSSLGQLLKEYAALPPDSPMRQVYMDAIKKATTHAPAATMNNFGSPVAGTDPRTGAPAFAVTDKQGNVKVLTAIAPPGKDMTEGQAKANLFGTRAKEADQIINGLARAGTVAPSFAQQATGGEGMTGALATAFATPQQQQADQAQRDFINAVLRRESGAVIAIPEMQNARKQYFPQPGDSPQVIAQKARNRQVAIAGILAEVPDAKRGAGVPAAAPASSDDPLGLRK